jgi:hypothetical protein
MRSCISLSEGWRFAGFRFRAVMGANEILEGAGKPTSELCFQRKNGLAEAEAGFLSFTFIMGRCSEP